MSYQIDSEENEVRSLTEAVDWVGKQVLEIGCGDGRLARRMANLNASVTAVDSDAELVSSAVRDDQGASQLAIRYGICDGQHLPFGAEAFDIVIFGWSL
jgi:2-polyprenyl-6-hydroxyphenyl methylase/3-demethylubiquinone-9 3-methyltransferase